MRLLRRCLPRRRRSRRLASVFFGFRCSSPLRVSSAAGLPECSVAKQPIYNAIERIPFLYQSGVTRMCHTRAHGQTAAMDAGTAGAVRRAGSRDVGQLREGTAAHALAGMQQPQDDPCARPQGRRRMYEEVVQMVLDLREEGHDTSYSGHALRRTHGRM